MSGMLQDGYVYCMVVLNHIVSIAAYYIMMFDVHFLIVMTVVGLFLLKWFAGSCIDLVQVVGIMFYCRLLCLICHDCFDVLVRHWLQPSWIYCISMTGCNLNELICYCCST